MNRDQMPEKPARIEQTSEVRRIVRMTISLSVSLLATLLLITGVRAAESTRQTNSAQIGQEILDPSWLQSPDHDDDESEIYGQLAFSVTSFTGEWVVKVGGNQQITVILVAGIDVEKFDDRLPLPGDWLKAEGVFLPDGRLSASRVRPDDFEENEVIVRLKPGNDAQALAHAYDMTVSAVLPSANIFLFSTPDDEEGEVNKLLTDPRIEWAETNRVSRVPSGDPYRTWKWGTEDESGYTNQSAFEQVNLAPAREKVSGAGVTVAILDTGIDLEHPVFDGALVLLANSNMILDTGAPDDTGPGLAWGHGTHIAGIVHGIAPGAKIMPIRVLDNQGRGNTFVLAYAIELAVNNGADVISLSLGADCESRILKEMVEVAINEGVVIVAAAGNEGQIAPQCPASLPGVLSVGAVDENRRRAVWSNYGRWVTLAAPGIGITSTFPLGFASETNATPGYASWSGTSMATPFVAGAAALVIEKRADEQSELAIGETLSTFGDDISLLNPAPFWVGRHLNIASAVIREESEEPETPPGNVSFPVFLPTVFR